MGSLTHWTFTPELVERFPLFIETGTGDGRGLEYAAKHKFERLWSIDIWEPNYREVSARTTDPRITLLHGRSDQWLETLLSDRTHPVFIFLDAHFPGADVGRQPFDGEPEYEIRLPLYREMETIRRCRPDGNFCILIDDVHLYHQKAPWGDGPIVEVVKNAIDIIPEEDRGLRFLYPFYHTHECLIDYHDSGYAIVKPYGTPSLTYTR